MGLRMCRKGKSCGATCIAAQYRCVLELGPLLQQSLGQVRDKLGVMGLWREVKAQKVRGNVAKFDKIKKQVEKDVNKGLPLRQQKHLEEFRNRLLKEGLLPEKKKSENAGDIFNKAVQKLPSVPSDLKRQIAALEPMAPRQLDRSPRAQTRTAPEVRRDLANPAKKRDSTSLMMDDISRILRGSIPKNLEVASAQDELGIKARTKQSKPTWDPGSMTGGTRWARLDADDFDGAFKIYKRIRGDQVKIDWDESVTNGKKIGEGSFGTVLKVGNVAHKRGEVGAEEANIIKRVGEAGIGPRLLGAEISTKKRDGYGVDLHNGRIAMTVVPGKELGEGAPDKKIAGKNAADIYWKAMANIHRLGIAHNDAHPHNLLVDNKGVGRWVDLGLAQQSPKAALAEAMGIFNTIPGAQASRGTKAAGQGNWQTRGWTITGVEKAELAKSKGTNSWKEFMERFPTAAKVWENRADVQYKMQKMGLSKKDISTVIDHGIRSPLNTYNNGVWAKLTDKQAQDLLNTLYDGV